MQVMMDKINELEEREKECAILSKSNGNKIDSFYTKILDPNYSNSLSKSNV